MKKLLAFHGKAEIKTKYLDRVKAHREADEIIHGTYWEKGKGCAVGCTVEKSQNAHEAMEEELGIPKELAYLEDVLFEEMSNGHAKEWPERFLTAITPGADLSLVASKFMVWQWEDSKFGLGVIKEITDNKELLKICEDVVGAYKKVINGEIIKQSEWEELYKRADDIYWAGAWAGAGAGAGAWAWAGAGAGAGARARAWAGAWAGAGAGAEYDKVYKESILAAADKLIELLQEA